MNSMLTHMLHMRRTRAMKRIHASGIAVLLATASSGAFAADLTRLPAVAPMQQPTPVVPVWTWTGFYLGFNVGGNIGVDSGTSALSSPPTSAEFPNNPFLFSNVRRAFPGGIAGGQIGYNWQVAPSWVFGIEGDWQWSGDRSTSSVTGQNISLAVFTSSYSDEERINSIATARARFGWTRDSFLWYVTGGGAWADIKNDYTITSTLPALTFPSPSGANFSTTKSGWTVGGGVETHLGGNWTAKLEYLFVDLGTVDHTFTTPVTAAGTFGIFDSTHSVQDHIIRIGVNYKFW
jgi:outer membrane immunogenic protein